MRTLLKVQVPVEQGNKAVNEGSIARIVETALEQLKPEAAYFYAVNGERTFHFVFDLQESAQIPAIAEPFFQGLNAKVDLMPVMNSEDLRSGLSRLAKKR